MTLRSQFVFFDDRMLQASDRMIKRALSRFGAYVRSDARRSIRKRKKASPAGSPPSSHTGRLKNNIYFGYDERKKSVVVGPLKFGAMVQTVPNILEYGGMTAERSRPRSYSTGERGPVAFRNGRLVLGRLKTSTQCDRAARLAAARNARQARKYPARPFMRPAFQKNIGAVDSLFNNQYKKG